MRRRRQQKLERRLQQFRSKDGGPDTGKSIILLIFILIISYLVSKKLNTILGGTLKIYGESLCPDVPYKTLLLSINDCSASVVREMLDKYGLGKIDPQLYCLIQVCQILKNFFFQFSLIIFVYIFLKQVNGQDNSEYILDDDECPLAIVMSHPHSGK